MNPQAPIVDVTIAEELDLETAPEVVEAAVMAGLVDQDRPGQVSVHLTSDHAIRLLNRKFRGRDEPTDVLSFSLDLSSDASISLGAPLGDVVISFPRAVEQAAKFGHSLDRELAWLAVHGTLQLLGYSHETQETESAMHAIEERILYSLGLERPSS